MLSETGLRNRAALFTAIRRFFQERDYIEVETPIRLPAMIPESNIEPIPAAEHYLQTSPEMCMKRLLSAGTSKIFQICKCFRKGERGQLHLMEFTMLEWYRTGIDYLELMQECEALVQTIAKDLLPCSPVRDGAEINLQAPWERMSVAEAFDRYAPVTVDEALAGDRFDEVLVQSVEPNLGREHPVFLYDYPASLGALARLKKNDPNVAERFELYIGGLELANGFSELIEVDEQRQRFEIERQSIIKQGRDPGPMPERFLDDLSRMPAAAGIALGIDRLAMILFDAQTIDEVVTFVPEEL
ncbi:EF-P lysine aminoacylase EpmA [Thermodesulfobacteriota bacterium]